MSDKRGLIILAREPLPGRVKTRLAATIGDSAAAELYEAMLRTVLKMSKHLDGVQTVVFWDCEEENLPLLSKTYGSRSLCQSPGDLGQRMHNAFKEMFAEGFEVCCIIGSDAPDLPSSYIREAFDILAAKCTDAVFGPTHDGGYYLLGLLHIRPQLFVNIDWGTPDVLRQSLANAAGAGIKTAILPEWYDIDTIEDLNALKERNRLRLSRETL